jgi:hypothetical protein
MQDNQCAIAPCSYTSLPTGNLLQATRTPEKKLLCLLCLKYFTLHRKNKKYNTTAVLSSDKFLCHISTIKKCCLCYPFATPI